MKRCTQCEFIYEDDQSHCDMDGARLTHDSHLLPKLQALTTTAGTMNKSKWRSRVVPIIAALILTSVLGLVYYVSIRQSSRRSAAVAISAAAESPANNLEISQAPASNAVPSPESSSETDSKTTPETKAATETDANTSPGEPSSMRLDSKKPETKSSTKPTSSDRKPRTKQQVQNNTRPTTVVKPDEKKDSKVRSMWRKTGRFLKKTLPL